MGESADGKKNIMETFLSVSEKAGVNVIIADNIIGTAAGRSIHLKDMGKRFNLRRTKLLIIFGR
jgi:hypothetical protein